MAALAAYSSWESNSSITKLVFGAILRVLLSRNRSCTEPVGEV
jgi:hypothetical protein